MKNTNKKTWKSPKVDELSIKKVTQSGTGTNIENNLGGGQPNRRFS